jgi:glycosyltransferase involved in cell wall biosynthesis
MIGVVVIGRNEGERLQRCLASVIGAVAQVVYVDSGSTDGSVNMARALGAEVVELDMSIPFTAARARNEGFARLQSLMPEISYVQFVDGDCEVVEGWLLKASAFLDAHPEVAVVCGRRRERFPDRSIYNLLCDLEWDTPVGEAKACGGDALMRVEAFNAVGAYRSDLIAGEEPELCVRLRSVGWKIWRIAEDMTLHDAAMTRFGQWWKRTMRGGHAFAEGAFLHGAPPERHWVRESRRAWLWGLVIPVGIICSTIILGWSGLVFLFIYPVQVVRLALKSERTPRENWLLAFFLVLGKFPEALGQLKFQLRKVGAGKTALIEYK